MSTPIIDLPEKDFDRHDEAQQLRAKFKIIRSYVPDDVSEADEDRRTAQQVEILALGTDAANFVIADLAPCSGARAFVDAVMGATGGSDEFVFVKDEELAERMGVSTKTVQAYRKEFCAVKNHSALIEVKPNYRDAVTHESFPHRYKCKLTALAVEAMGNAKLAPGWSGDTKAKMRAMKEAAEVVARGASFGGLTKPPKRRKPTDGEVVAGKLRLAANALADAGKRRSMVKNPNFEELRQLRQSVLASLKAFDEAFDFATPHSMLIQEEEGGSTPGEVLLDSSELSPRMEAEVVLAGEKIEDVENAQVEKSSTCNDSIESTTCEVREIPQIAEKPSDDDSPTTLYIEHCQRIYDEEIANGATDKEARAAARRKSFAEWERERVEVWERTFAGLRGGKRDG